MRPHHSPFNPPFLFIACKHIKPMRKLIFDSLNFDASSFLEVQVKIHKSCLTREKKNVNYQSASIFLRFQSRNRSAMQYMRNSIYKIFSPIQQQTDTWICYGITTILIFCSQVKMSLFYPNSYNFFLFHFTILATVSFHSCHLHIHLQSNIQVNVYAACKLKSCTLTIELFNVFLMLCI